MTNKRRRTHNDGPQRLADALRERLAAIGKDDKWLKNQGRPSRPTVDDMLRAERDVSSYQDRVIADIETAVGWQPGSVEAIDDGNPPTIDPNWVPPVDDTTSVVDEDDELTIVYRTLRRLMRRGVAPGVSTPDPEMVLRQAKRAFRDLTGDDPNTHGNG